MRMKILMLLAGVLLLTACSNFRETSVSDDGESRMLMTDNDGEVEIPTEPERMVLLRPVDVLNAHLLGADIAAVTENVSDNDFVNRNLDDVDFISHEDTEAVAAIDPGVIIVSSQEAERQKYAEIAPTLALNYNDEFFNAFGDRVYLMQLNKMGVILGEQEKASELVNGWMERMTEHRRKLTFDPGEHTAVVLVEGGDGFYIYDEYSAYGTEIMYDLLNFNVAEDALDVRQEDPFKQFRPDELESIETDYVLVNKQPGTGEDALVSELAAALSISEDKVLVADSENFITNDLISLEGQADIVMEQLE